MSQGPRLLSAALLPSFVTLGNLACGVGSLVFTIEAARTGELHSLATAGWLLVLATFLDALDGKLARLTGSTSELGAQLDSLADLATFGVAPAILARTFVLLEGPELGIRMHPRLLVVAPILYACCTALRLARFNVEHHAEGARRDHRYFVGLPSPAAAALPVSLVLFYFAVADPRFTLPASEAFIEWVHESTLRIMPFLLVLLGTFMVTRIPFPHFVALLTRGRHPFQRLAEITIIVLLLAIETELALLIMATAFLAIPSVKAAWESLRRPLTSRAGG